MKYLITGTHAYGPVRLDSDLDIVMMIDDAHLMRLFLITQGIWMYRTSAQDSYGPIGGFYFDLATMRVNIIIANNEWEFDEWKWRTERMKGMPDIHDREERIAAFNDGEKEAKSA